MLGSSKHDGHYKHVYNRSCIYDKCYIDMDDELEFLDVNGSNQRVIYLRELYMQLQLIDESKIKELDGDDDCNMKSDEIGKASYGSIGVYDDNVEL